MSLIYCYRPCWGGYEDPLHFSRVFKQLNALSPTEHRRENSHEPQKCESAEFETTSLPLRVPLEVHHYGQADLSAAVVEWSFTTRDGKVLAQGRTDPKNVVYGANTVVGEAVMTVGAGPAQEVTLVTTIAGHEISNRWRVWTYPRTPALAPKAEEVKVVEHLDDALLDFVKKGGRALVIADQLDYQVPVYFTNPIWTPQNNIETTGLLIREKHGALAEFPTASHSDFQWHNFLRPGRGFILNEPPQFCTFCASGDGKIVVT